MLHQNIYFHIQRACQTSAGITAGLQIAESQDVDIILVTVYFRKSMLHHEASNRKKVKVMTQKSTNRYMQSSAQRQRYSQWARGRRLHKDPYLRRAVSQFLHKKHHDGMKKAFKTQCWLTCPQKAIDKYSYYFYLCLLFSLIMQICPCVAKNAEGNWNNETYTQLNLSSTVSIQSYKGWGEKKNRKSPSLMVIFVAVLCTGAEQISR